MFFRRVFNFCKLVKLKIIQNLRIVLGQRLVHVIGDSHTLSFQSSKLIVHYLGAITAFNLVKENSNSGGRVKLFRVLDRLTRQDRVLLVFGEIDCRIHIFNQFMKKNKKIAMTKIIQETVSNYGQVIDEIKALGIQVAIYNIVPPGPQGNIYSYPFYADWPTRLKITNYMNMELKKLCRRRGLLFVDIYNEVINPNAISERSYRKKDYIFDDVHLNDKITDLVLKKMHLMD